MRLVGILETGPSAQKRHWGVALLLTTVGASGVGLMSAAATTNDTGKNAGSSSDEYVLVDYIKQTSLELPARCPGLIADLKNRGVQSEGKEITLDDRLVSQQTMKIGTVILSHDIRRDGSINNPRIIDSTHPCFDANARAAITEWMAEPRESEIRNVAVKVYFGISGATNEELNQQLKNLDQ